MFFLPAARTSSCHPTAMTPIPKLVHLDVSYHPIGLDMVFTTQKFHKYQKYYLKFFFSKNNPYLVSAMLGRHLVVAQV